MILCVEFYLVIHSISFSTAYLSLYHLSQVTVCLAMYLVSFFGIIVSFGYRIFCFTHFSYRQHMALWNNDNPWPLYRVVSYIIYFLTKLMTCTFSQCMNNSLFHFLLLQNQLYTIEGLLFASSVCVSVLLIFLCSVARLALKSTNTQVISVLLLLFFFHQKEVFDFSKYVIQFYSLEGDISFRSVQTRCCRQYTQIY